LLPARVLPARVEETKGGADRYDAGFVASVMRDTMSHEVGGVLFEVGDRYEVLGLLGQGSFGIVAAGLERGTGKKLAIKRVQPIAVSCSGARHVLRELAIMRALRYHPNVR